MTLDDVIIMVLFVSCVSGLFGILALVADWLESKEEKK